VLRNSALVNTLDLRSPIGSPLADVTPSRGFLRLLGRCDEKKSEPSANDEALVINGEIRARGCGSPPCVGNEEDGGLESESSYMSRRRSKSVGKKMSKKPCLTNNVEHGTVTFRYRV